jgi:hypothetical protein
MLIERSPRCADHDLRIDQGALLRSERTTPYSTVGRNRRALASGAITEPT